MKKQIALLALVLISTALGYIAFKSSSELRQNWVKTDVESLFLMKEVHIVQQKAGVKLWELKADRSKDVFSSKDTVLENVSAVVYGRNTVNISAAKGTISKGGNDISLSGNVVVSLKKEKVSLVTESARFHEDTIGISVPFTLTSPAWSFSGTMLTLNTLTEVLEATNGVEVTINDL